MTWRCGVCDFDNPEEVGICQMCNMPRGVSLPIQNNQQLANGDRRQFVSSLLPLLLPINPIRQNQPRNNNSRNSVNNLPQNQANIQNNEEPPPADDQQNVENQANQFIEVNDTEDGIDFFISICIRSFNSINTISTTFIWHTNIRIT